MRSFVLSTLNLLVPISHFFEQKGSDTGKNKSLAIQDASGSGSGHSTRNTTPSPQKSVVAMMAAPPPAQKIQRVEDSPVVKSLLADSKSTAAKVDKMAEAVLALTNFYKQDMQDMPDKEDLQQNTAGELISYFVYSPSYELSSDNSANYFVPPDLEDNEDEEEDLERFYKGGEDDEEPDEDEENDEATVTDKFGGEKPR